MLDDADGQTDFVVPASSQQDVVKYLFGVLARRWRYVVGITIGTVIIAGAALLLVSPRYKSTVEILLLDPATQNLGDSDRTSTFLADSAAVGSEIDLLQSRVLASRVVRELHLDTDPEFAAPQKAGPPANAEQHLNAVADALRKHIRVDRQSTSYVLAVSATARDPLQAQRIAGTLVKDFLDDRHQIRKEALEQVKGWWTPQLNSMAQRLDLSDSGGRIISTASFPEAPSFPNKKLILAAALVFGAMLGGLTAFLIEMFDDTLRTFRATEQIVGRPVIGMIPLLEDGSRAINYRTLLDYLTRAPRSHLSELVRAVRVILRLRDPDGGKKVLLVTSAVAGEGKSAAATLIAATSALLGQKTALIDCDFRRRSISSQLAGSGPGWNDVVARQADLAAVTYRDEASGLCVIPVGPGGNPANVLLGQPMRDLLARLRSEYELIVIDAAPILGVVDAVVLAALADETLLVVEWGRTTTASVLEGLNVLRVAGQQITGVILNKVDRKLLRSYGDNYSAHAYGARQGEELFDVS